MCFKKNVMLTLLIFSDSKIIFHIHRNFECVPLYTILYSLTLRFFYFFSYWMQPCFKANIHSVIEEKKILLIYLNYFVELFLKSLFFLQKRYYTYFLDHHMTIIKKSYKYVWLPSLLNKQPMYDFEMCSL